MKHIILTTTPSFTNTIARSPDLSNFLSQQEIDVVLQEKLIPPFSFDPSFVFGLVAGAAVKIDAKALDIFPNLKIVMPFGVGLDHVDMDALNKRDIVMKMYPGINKNAVAELVIAFMLALARQLVVSTNDIREGKWDRLMSSEVAGKTLGIIGLGNIGKEVTKKAKALGMRVCVHDLVCDKSFLYSCGVTQADFETVLKESDFLSLHVPLSDLTQDFINERALSLMKKGAYLINTSRGEVINEKALLKSLESGALGGAALDVFSKEPPLGDKVLERLIAHPNVIATPHNATFTPETQYILAKRICEDMTNIFRHSL